MKQKYIIFTNKYLKFIKNDKIRLLFIPCILLLSIFLVISLGINSSGLMGNSAVNYYCEDKNYELRGNECINRTTISSILLGDVNLDNKISRDDASTLSKYLNGAIKLSSNQLLAADIDADGRVDSNDHNTIISLSVSESEYTTVNTTNNVNVSEKRVCPKSTDKNISYRLSGEKCVKETKVAAKLNQSGTFIVKYDSNGGISSDSTSMSDNTFDLSKANNKLQRNKYIKYKDNNFNNEPYLFAGWNAYNLSNNKILCYSNASHSDEEWIDKSDDTNPLMNNGSCKYGMYVFEDEETIKNIAAPNETIQMKAVWKNFFQLDGLTNAIADKNINVKNVAIKYNIGGFQAIHLPGSRHLNDYIKDGKDKIIQDLHVELDINNNEIFYLSQDLFSNDPHQLLITQIANNNSKVVVQHIGKCGHGMFDMNTRSVDSQVFYYLSCDSDSTYDKNGNNHGNTIYKINSGNSIANNVITPSSSKKISKVINGIKSHRENVKLDEKNGKALIRSSFDNQQHFYLYNFNVNNNTIDSNLIKEFTIKTTNRLFQGYDIDGNYLYIYSGDSKPESTAAYIEVYDINSSKLIKKSTVYDYKNNNIYMEAEGISIIGNYAYISMAITSSKAPIANQKTTIGDVATLNYKYALIYRIDKSKLLR